MPLPQRQNPKKKAVVKKTTAARKKTARPTSALDRIQPIGGPEGLRINLYGHSGTGKTTLWATFPKPILALVCSGTKRPGETLSINTPENRKTIKQLPVKSLSDLVEVAEYQAESNEYATVVLDHLTSFQDVAIKEVTGLDTVPIQKDWGLVTQSQWGQVGAITKELLSKLLDLRCNIVIVAQQRTFSPGEDDQELELESFIASAATPTIVSFLNASVDYICQTLHRPKMVEKIITIKGKKKKQLVRVPGVDFCLRVSPHSNYASKFRTPTRDRPEIIVDPTYDKIAALIKGD